MSVSFLGGILPGLRQEAGKGVIPSYRFLQPEEVISALTTARTSIFWSTFAKPGGWVEGLRPHSLDMPISSVSHLQPQHH